MSKSRARRRAVGLVAVSALAAMLTGGPAHAAAAADTVRVNEVVTTGDVNDSIELCNTGAAAVDISGWVLKGNPGRLQVPDRRRNLWGR